MPLNQFPRRSFIGSSTLQTFTGTGSQTAFTLSSAQTQNECFVFVEDVAQVPGVDFTVNGTTLTFTVAPANNAEIIIRGFGVPAPVTTVSDGAITAAKLATGAIEAKLGYTPVSPTQLSTEVNNLIAGAPGALNTLDELAAALNDDASFASTVTNSLAAKANTTDVNSALALKAGITSSTGALIIPVGTTAQRPASPVVGHVRYNTTTNALENFTSNGWLKVATPTPVINSISGNVFASWGGTITLSGFNFGTGAGTASFVSGGTSATAGATPSSDSSVSVVVPSTIFNLSSGTTINVSWTNADGGISAAGTFTLLALPSGGTITSSGSFRIHTFTSSSSFVVPTNRSVDVLLVAGGGAGGNNNAGGGGAGGLIQQTNVSINANTYTITIGAGGTYPLASGTGYPGNNGSNTTALGYTAIGGGGGNGGNVGSSGSGGSGGGDSRSRSGPGSGTAGQGNAGAPNPTSATGGGGGGAGGSGSGANGGVGLANSYSGSSVFYAGGGGGGAEGGGQTAGNGGNGGGGRGGIAAGASSPGGWSTNNGENGATNTGGGGGGEASGPAGSFGGNGGSGIVIIRYVP